MNKHERYNRSEAGRARSRRYDARHGRARKRRWDDSPAGERSQFYRHLRQTTAAHLAQREELHERLRED